MLPENLLEVVLKGMPDAGFAAVLDTQGKVDKGVNIFAKALPQPLANNMTLQNPEQCLFFFHPRYEHVVSVIK